MVKAGTDDIAKGKKKIDKSQKSRFLEIHLTKHIFKKRLFQVGLVAIGAILALLIIEIGLRVSLKKSYNLDPCTSLDSDFHHVLIPNKSCRFKTDEWDITININSFGQRDKEHWSDIKDNNFRILALGDSFTMGYGVDEKDTYIALLSEKLKEASSQKAEIINASVFGYSPLIYNLYLQKKGLSFDPDMVMVFFTLTDFWEDRQRFLELKKSYPDLTEEELLDKIESADVQFKFELINSPTGQVIKVSTLQKVKSYLRSNFILYATVVDFIKKRNQPAQQDVIYQGDIDRDIVALIRGDKISQDNWEELFRVPIHNLKIISRLLAARDIDLVIVLVPEAVQVSDQEWPNRIALGLPANFDDPRGPFQEEIIKRLADEKINFVNLLPDFHQSNIFPLYFTKDGHFRESGHRLAAEIILAQTYKYLQKRL